MGMRNNKQRTQECGKKPTLRFFGFVGVPDFQNLEMCSLIRDAADFLLFRAFAVRIDRSRNGKPEKLEIARVAKQIISKNNFRPEWGWTITAPYAVAFTFWTMLGNHEDAAIYNVKILMGNI